MRWINVAGLSDMHGVHALATKYNLHLLAIEDGLHLSQRPKIESYGEEGEFHSANGCNNSFSNHYK